MRLNPRTRFFATAEESAAWACEWRDRFRLCCAFARRSPAAFEPNPPWDDPEALVRAVRDYDVIFFRLDEIVPAGRKPSQLWAVNPGMLSVELPRVRPGGIRIGDFGTGTQDARCLKVWRALGRDFFAKTTNGMLGVFPNSPGSAFSENYRYSPGAAEWWRNGGTLLGVGDETWHPEPVDTPARADAGESA